MSQHVLVTRLTSLEHSLNRLSVSISEAKALLRRQESYPSLARLRLVVTETRDELNRCLNAITKHDIDNSD